MHPRLCSRTGSFHLLPHAGESVEIECYRSDNRQGCHAVLWEDVRSRFSAHWPELGTGGPTGNLPQVTEICCSQFIAEHGNRSYFSETDRFPALFLGRPPPPFAAKFPGSSSRGPSFRLGDSCRRCCPIGRWDGEVF